MPKNGAQYWEPLYEENGGSDHSCSHSPWIGIVRQACARSRLQVIFTKCLPRRASVANKCSWHFTFYEPCVSFRSPMSSFILANNVTRHTLDSSSRRLSARKMQPSSSCTCKLSDMSHWRSQVWTNLLLTWEKQISPESEKKVHRTRKEESEALLLLRGEAYFSLH